MGTMGECVPADAPLDERYWEALLRGGENGVAVVDPGQVGSFGERDPDDSEASSTAETVQDYWAYARELMERGEVLELPVVGCNRGGVLVGWNGLRGFVPASHLVSLSPSADENERYDELRNLVGTQLSVRIIELDRQDQRFVLSERATGQDDDRCQRVLDEISPGDVRRGYVTNLCSFGAFVDLGGAEGLVHVSELSWGRVEHPDQVLKPGEPVEVYVLEVDRERERVRLSVKRLQPDPWQFVEERYRVGQVLEAVVTHVVDFGAFARVEDGLEGLIHVSELADGGLVHPRDVVREGDVLTVRVLNIDGGRRRMGLSLRKLEEPPTSY
jgi:small subunit ribosomal protein S1